MLTHARRLFPTRGSATLIALLGALLLAACGSRVTEEEVSPPVLEGAAAAPFDALLKTCTTPDPANPIGHAAPGAILLVDTPAGRYLKARGLADIAKERPLRVDDPMQIGSNTKMFTGVLLLQQEERGALSLDDKLSTWLPEVAAKVPHGDRITVRHLATHISGIWDYADAIIGGGLADPSLLRKSYTPRELVEYAIANGKPDFEPGAEGMWKYSNTGYILLGMVIEKASGRTYAQLLQEHIFQPLKMKSAMLEEGSPPDDAPVRGYYDHSKGTDVTAWNLTQGWAAGAIICTAEDLARFGHALLEGTLFRKPETAARMREFLTGPRGLINSLSLGYGIGLQKLSENAYGHRGQTLGFNSILMMFPEENVVAIALTNDGMGPAMLMQGKLAELYKPAAKAR